MSKSSIVHCSIFTSRLSLTTSPLANAPFAVTPILSILQRYNLVSAFYGWIIYVNSLIFWYISIWTCCTRFTWLVMRIVEVSSPTHSMPPTSLISDTGAFLALLLLFSADAVFAVSTAAVIVLSFLLCFLVFTQLPCATSVWGGEEENLYAWDMFVILWIWAINFLFKTNWQLYYFPIEVGDIFDVRRTITII